jgi:hypothetical protein
MGNGAVRADITLCLGTIATHLYTDKVKLS